MYICPLCQLPLIENRHGQACQNGHQFDRAREGYINLLPVQQKKSLDPGDNPTMIQARREFLTAGHYQPLSDALNQRMLQLPLPPNAAVLDLGCGEGYYSARLQQALEQQSSQHFGIDISKAAIKAAAKRYPSIHFAVASSYALPFPDQSVDAIFRIYAPSKSAELTRICKAAGYLLTITPAPHHLFELKQRIYAEVRLHSSDVTEEPGFNHQQRQQLSWIFQPKTPTELNQLLSMIPLGYRMTPEVEQRLVQELPAIQLDFYLDLYQKTA